MPEIWTGFMSDEKSHRQDVKELIKTETFVTPPVARGRKKIKARAGYPGKVKIFTKEEILQISTTLRRKK